MSVEPPQSNLSTVSNEMGLNPFPTTHWSAISAARGHDDHRARKGLEKLAANYWRPLYFYLRKCGESHEDASDTVQGFFEHMLGSTFLSYIKRDGRRFRSYLLKSLDRWRSRRRVHNGALKRGGHIAHVSFEDLEEAGIQFRENDSISAAAAYDREWALNLLGVAVNRLRHDYIERGREHWFDALRGALPGNPPLPPYAELAKQLESSEGAIKKAVHDLRHAFATRLRQEIRATVTTKDDAAEELRYLMSVLSS